MYILSLRIRKKIRKNFFFKTTHYLRISFSLYLLILTFWKLNRIFKLNFNIFNFKHLWSIPVPYVCFLNFIFLMNLKYEFAVHNPSFSTARPIYMYVARFTKTKFHIADFLFRSRQWHLVNCATLLMINKQESINVINDSLMYSNGFFCCFAEGVFVRCATAHCC